MHERIRRSGRSSGKGGVRMLTEEAKRRLSQRYGVDAAAGPQKKELNVTGRGAGRMRAMQKNEKPQDTKESLRALLSFLAHEKGLVAAALFCAVAHTVTSLTASYLLRPVMNRFLYHDPAETDLTSRLRSLRTALLFMCVLYLVSVVTQYLQSRIMLSVSQRSLRRMRDTLYEKLMTLPVRFFDTHKTGDIMSRFTNDIDMVGEMLNTTLMQIVSGVLTVIGSIILMLYTSPVLGMITLLLTPLLLYVTKLILKYGRAAFRRQTRTLGAMNGYAEEMIGGLRVLKVFTHEGTSAEEFDALCGDYAEAHERAQFISGLIGPVTHQLCNMAYAVTAAVGGFLVVLRNFDIGGLAVSLNYTRTFNRPVNEISMQLSTIYSALAGFERIEEILKMEGTEAEVLESAESRGNPDAETAEGAAESTGPSGNTVLRGDIDLSRVTFGYVPDIPVLRDISLHARPGEKIALVGSTGAGKTTVTNLLTRFYGIDSGSITIDGRPIESIPLAVLRGNIAMVLQDTHLFTGTVRENIRYGRPGASDDDVVAAAKAASAHYFILRLKDGYDTVLTHDGASLSQGQRQLLGIARAAISHAPILILDEATSSVDTLTEKHIEEGMDALMSGRTTLVIAHRLSTVRTADNILVLEHGRILESGNHKTLLEKGGRYADLYREIAELD